MDGVQLPQGIARQYVNEKHNARQWFRQWMCVKWLVVFSKKVWTPLCSPSMVEQKSKPAKFLYFCKLWAIIAGIASLT